MAELVLPCQIGNFRCERLLGKGGMGEVYAAVEDITSRDVALKLMAPELANDAHGLKRFRREVQLIAQLDHPGVPGCAGWGEHEGRQWVAMEQIKGRSLEDMLVGGKKLPEEQALHLMHQTALVLDYCYRTVGMVHRDIKPGNLMLLSQSGQVDDVSSIKLIDYGLALFLDIADGENFGEVRINTGVHNPDDISGTPAYMSPEQIRGDALDFHSDVYALGVMLYRFATGQLPYDHAELRPLLQLHLEAPIPDAGRLTPLGASTVLLIQRCMAKQPQARFRSYAQFLSMVDAALIEARARARRGDDRNTARRLSAIVAPPPSGSGWRRPVIQPPTEKFEKPPEGA